MEGNHPFLGSPNGTAGSTPPVVEYDHTQGSAVTGGMVYRGSGYPSLQGIYLYGDWGNGRIWGLRRENGTWHNVLLADTDLNILTFGDGEDGSLYVTDYTGGGVYKITATAITGPEIQVGDGTTDLQDGTGSVGYGTTPLGIPVTRTFTVSNIGSAALSLGAITLPAGFSLAAGFGTATVGPGASTTFSVRFDAAAAGTAAVASASPPTTPTRTRSTSPSPPPPRCHRGAGRRRRRRRVRHRRDAGPPSPTRATASDVHYAAAGTGSSTASWPSPAGAGPATGSRPPGRRSPTAPPTPRSPSWTATTPLGTVAVNQQLAPAGFTDRGAAWQDLGALHDHRHDPDGPAVEPGQRLRHRRRRPHRTVGDRHPRRPHPGLRRQPRPSPTGPAAWPSAPPPSAHR